MSKVSAVSLTILLVLLCPMQSKAITNGPDCEALAEAAGREAGIPEGILPAIARVESGRNGRAWPWTLNHGGDGSFYPTKDAALIQLAELLGSDVQNVDLGCMQINWRWHSTAFADAAEMMDPVANTRYAARFLADLREQHGSWESAVAAYHSGQPIRGAAYGQKVAQERETMRAQQPIDAPMPLLPENDSAATRSAVVRMTRGLRVLSGQPVVLQTKTQDKTASIAATRLFPHLLHPVISAGN